MVNMSGRLTEALQFLTSFKNPEATRFLIPFLISNYNDAILAYHPNPETISPGNVHNKCTSLIETVFERINNIKNNPEKLFDLFYQLSRSNPDQDPIWFDEFLSAYQNYKHNKKLVNRYKQLSPYLTGSSFCDIGCGGGDMVASFLKQHDSFTHAAGIDIMDWRTDEIKELIEFQMLDFTKPGVSSEVQYDTLTTIAVLHHTGSSEENMITFLRNLMTAVKKGGRLIIEEDVIIPGTELVHHQDLVGQIEELKQEQRFLEPFLSFDQSTQRDIIILIDLLANCLSVGVPDMPFPCGFQTLDSWLGIFDKVGFNLREVRIQGFVQNNFNQSCHVFFILEN